MVVFSDVGAIIEHLRTLETTPSVEAEGFTELDHGLQTAAILRAANPDDLELQVAGLVHDLAHPWDEPGQPMHALWGADAVRPVLGERVAMLVAGHVPAKRWLVTRDPDYRALLSEDSIMTLAAQGGDMDAHEIAWFESLAHWEAMVELRRADDGAKVVGAIVPGLDDYLDALERVAAAHS